MDRTIELEGVKNSRELGGIETLDGRHVKNGLLIRTGRLEDISPEGIKTLQNLNVKKIIDLRSEFELADHPDPELPGMNRELVPLLDADSDEGKTAGKLIAGYKENKDTFVRAYESGFSMYPLYESFITREFSLNALKKMFRIFIEQPEGEAVLWHCNGGKDRTGLLGVLLLGTLGVDNVTIADDFELSNEGCKEQIEMERQIAAQFTDDQEIIYRVGFISGVDREHMEKLINLMCEKYGSIVDFVKQKLDVSDEDIELLKAKYLE